MMSYLLLLCLMLLFRRVRTRSASRFLRVIFYTMLLVRDGNSESACPLFERPLASYPGFPRFRDRLRWITG